MPNGANSPAPGDWSAPSPDLLVAEIERLQRELERTRYATPPEYARSMGADSAALPGQRMVWVSLMVCVAALLFAIFAVFGRG